MARKNKLVIPEAKEPLDLDKFKMESAKEVEVNLRDSYNVNSADKGTEPVGGNTVERMIKKSYEED